MYMKLMNAGLALLVVWVLWIPKGAWSESNPQIYDPASMEERFENWLKQYGREYGSQDEWEQRLRIYSSNVQYIDHFNSQNMSFQLTDNKFADLSNEEFVSTYLGYKKLYREWRQPSKKYLGLPTFVTGSCWAFSAVAAASENNLQARVSVQPVSVAIDAGGYAFQLYSHGVFNGYCGQHLNHGVTAIGYGEDGGQKYWLVKNSWGTGWGESGYIRMVRNYPPNNIGICGILMEASYPVKNS